MQARMSRDVDAVLAAKIALGEAGPVWWTDGAADFSDARPEDTPYAEWWEQLTDAARQSGKQ